MKLDYRRTIKVGIAFLIIMVFWEVYDFAVPLMLDRSFGLSQSARGLVMGLDNLLAIFLLPLFGMLSDRSKGKRFGRRTPFILIGAVCAIVTMLVMAGLETVRLNDLVRLGVNDPSVLAAQGYLDPQFLQGTYQSAVSGSAESLAYATAFHDAQTAFAASFNKTNPGLFIGFIATLLFVLIAMAAFRSPAVALMPDVTTKSLRSTGNAVINFMGGAGAFLSILLYTFLSPDYGSYLPLFCALAGVMGFALLTYVLTVKENRFVALRMEEERRWQVVDEEESDISGKLCKGKKISLVLILLCVFFWFMGYNAVKSHLSVYATTVLHMKSSAVGFINMANGVGGAIALIPVAFFANRLGRKKSVLIGLMIAAVSFIPCFWIGFQTRSLLGVLFVAAGFGLIIINVNTLPMVVELSRGSNVGRFTGFYYVAAMTAQAITPYIAGLLMERTGDRSMFLYAAACILTGFVIALFIRHGDNKPTKGEIKESLFDA